MAFVYEGVLLFGVVMAVGLIYGIVTQQRHALRGHDGLQVVVFLALAAYFIGFWTYGGQTLAMRTWHVRLVSQDRQPVRLWQAAFRYLLCWAYLLPALGLAWWLHLKSAWGMAALVAGGCALWGATALLSRDRRFVHDRLCGTCLIDTRPMPAAPSAPVR